MGIKFFQRKPKYRIITDGENFAIQKRNGKLIDLMDSEFTWTTTDLRFLNDCWGTEEQVMKMYKRLQAMEF